VNNSKRQQFISHIDLEKQISFNQDNFRHLLEVLYFNIRLSWTTFSVVFPHSLYSEFAALYYIKPILNIQYSYWFCATVLLELVLDITRTILPFDTLA